MPAPFPQARNGRKLESPPSGFPAFFQRRQPRVVTADVWAFLRHLVSTKLSKERRREALAYLEQASEFFDAAANPRLGSKPLLYYYSFMNLAKTALLVDGTKLPPACRHGIFDPKANIKRRVRLPGQRVGVQGLANDHSELFPEFVKLLGGSPTATRSHSMRDLMEQVPSIHRTFMRVTGDGPSFLPIRRVELLKDAGQIWSRVAFQRSDKDVQETLPVVKKRRAFRRVLKQVVPPATADDEVWYETKAVPGKKRGVDKAIRTLASSLQAIGIWTLLTSDGYRTYFWTGEPRKSLPPLAAVYAVMFYLGSITRYKPYDFDRIIEGGYSFLVGEILATQPTQFVYALASNLAGVDVVKPYASL
jgi:hypothetical protein